MGNSQREKVAKAKGGKASKINLREAVSIGIGGMVGGGIFAVLGLSVELAGGAVPLSFTVAGIIALLTSYSYSKRSPGYEGLTRPAIRLKTLKNNTPKNDESFLRAYSVSSRI